MTNSTSKTVKCLVWDLDQTLWRGVLLEDGKVEVAPEVREVVVELDGRGILQSIASRNDHDHAWEWLKRLGMAEYFVLPQIGWGAKSDSVRAIADRLGFAYDAIALVDDRPAERAEVAHHLPAVRCYAAEDVPGLLARPELTPAVITEDARRRRAMYQAGLRRELARVEHDGPDEDFLLSLHLRLAIRRTTDADLARVAELTQRTSQMNATGVYHSEVELRALIADPGHEVLLATLEDRFGSHGAIGIMLLAPHPRVWHLKLLATSCRVIQFGVGAALLRWLIDQAARAGAHLVTDFRRTERNRMMEVAYRFAGLAPAGCRCAAGIATAPDVQLLHLVPSRQQPPATMSVTAPELTELSAIPS